MPITRRDLLKSAAAVPGLIPMLRAAKESRTFALQSFIFVQQLRNQASPPPLAEKLEEFFSTMRDSGFKNVELMSNFISPAVSKQTASVMAAKGLSPLIVYTGATLHDSAAEKGIEQVLATADTAKAMGVKAINCNPSPKRGERKTDEELALQARNLNRLAEHVQKRGLRFLIHHHAPEMAENAREWRHILANTDPATVSFCVDIEWAFHDGQDPMALLKEAGRRVGELHLRNSRKRVWAEAFEDGDIDYKPVVEHIDKLGINPYLVVELAYDPETRIARPLLENIRVSRMYAEKMFGA